MSLDSEASKYNEALELYGDGPAKAPQIIKLLNEHIEDNPKDDKAFKLLGITQFGIEDNEGALATFEKTIKLLDEDGRISAQILMYKARTLFALKRMFECRRLLEVYWAFWQDDEQLKRSYEWHWERVKEAEPPNPKNGEQVAAPNP